MKAPLTLVIDDEPDIRELLEITLNRMDIKTFCADSLQSAKQLLPEHDFDLCLTDMNLPDGNGLHQKKEKKQGQVFLFAFPPLPKISVKTVFD